MFPLTKKFYFCPSSSDSFKIKKVSDFLNLLVPFKVLQTFHTVTTSVGPREEPGNYFNKATRRCPLVVGWMWLVHAGRRLIRSLIGIGTLNPPPIPVRNLQTGSDRSLPLPRRSVNPPAAGAVVTLTLTLLDLQRVSSLSPLCLFFLLLLSAAR